jgi:hypothetical protein
MFIKVNNLLTELSHFPRKPSQFVNNLTWLAIGIFLGLLIAFYFITYGTTV